MQAIERIIVEIRPPRIAMSLVGVAGLIYALFPVVRTSFGSFSIWCGLGVFLPGTAVMLWAWTEFQKRENPICPTQTPVALIRSGPFRFTRNPMYLGMLLMLLSPAIALGSPLFLFPPIVFFGVINFVFIPFEEKVLHGSFGEAFTNYAGRVRRWI